MLLLSKFSVILVSYFSFISAITHKVRFTHSIIGFFLALSTQPVIAQNAHEVAEARSIYRQANTKPNTATLRAGLARQANGFFGDGTFQPGALRTFDGRYRPVPGLRYHAGLRLVEVLGDYQLRPYDEATSPRMVFILKK